MFSFLTSDFIYFYQFYLVQLIYFFKADGWGQRYFAISTSASAKLKRLKQKYSGTLYWLSGAAPGPTGPDTGFTQLLVKPVTLEAGVELDTPVGLAAPGALV